MQANPCLAAFCVRGNKHRGILNHGLPAAMLLNLFFWGGEGMQWGLRCCRLYNLSVAIEVNSPIRDIVLHILLR